MPSDAMSPRERFRRTLHFEPVDRIPLMDFGFWHETIEQWQRQGLPESLAKGTKEDQPAVTRYFGMDPGWTCLGPVGMCPGLEPTTVEETDDYVIFRDGAGVLTKQGRHQASIPLYLDWLLKDRASWEQHFKWRFDPDHPDKQKVIEQHIEWGKNYDGDGPLGLNIGSTYGWLRNWMGVENVSLIIYDDPALFEEMVQTVSDHCYEICRRVLEAGVKFDYAHGWEDMCYKSGPLISPAHFKKYLVPHYRRICDLAHKYGIDVITVDCDGKIDDLIPHWLEAGVNCMFPLEIGTWDADPIKYRRQYGKDLLVMGGFDKHILAKGPGPIDAEIRRLLPLVEQGGFIPFCDHRVPPDVSLANYRHYVAKAKQIWCKDINFPPPAVG